MVFPKYAATKLGFLVAHVLY